MKEEKTVQGTASAEETNEKNTKQDTLDSLAGIIPDTKKDSAAKQSLRDILLPCLIGGLIAVMCVVWLKTGLGTKVKGAEGSYSAYLNDGSLSKIGTYTVTAVRNRDGALVYEGSKTKIYAKDGLITIIDDSGANIYADAFVMKDK